MTMTKFTKNFYKTKTYFQLKQIIILTDIIKFNQLNKKIRNNFKINKPQRGQNFKTANSHIFNNPQTLKSYHSELNNLIKEIKNKIPKKWWHGINNLKDKIEWWLWIDIPSHFENEIPFKIKTIKEIPDKLYIEISSSTRIEDLIKHWNKSVKPAQQKLNGYKESQRDPWIYYHRDKKIYNLYKNGLKEGGIYTAMKKDGLDLDIGNIKRIISDYKSAMAINPNKRD